MCSLYRDDSYILKLYIYYYVNWFFMPILPTIIFVVLFWHLSVVSDFNYLPLSYKLDVTISFKIYFCLFYNVSMPAKMWMNASCYLSICLSISLVQDQSSRFGLYTRLNYVMRVSRVYKCPPFCHQLSMTSSISNTSLTNYQRLPKSPIPHSPTIYGLPYHTSISDNDLNQMKDL